MESKNNIKSQEDVIQLAEITKNLPEMDEVGYFLYRIRGRMGHYFAVEISMGEEHAMCILNRDPDIAKNQFTRLTENNATPDGLREVMGEMERENELKIV